jgi:hypothetical protein
MRVFAEAVLPNTCYLPEGVLWLALGRVPQVLTKVSDYGEDYSETDPRTNRRALDEDERLIDFDPGFSQSEFELLGVDVDFERYAATKRLVQYEAPHRLRPTGADVLAAYDQRREVFRALGHPPKEELSSVKRAAVQEGVDWMNRMDALFESSLDLARVELFRALTAGEIEALGWLDAPGTSTAESRDATLLSIPNYRWSLKNARWDESELSFPDGVYHAVQLPTEKLLKRFPRPLCAHKSLSFDVYPGCILVDDDKVSVRAATVPSRRGNPGKGGGVYRRAVVNVFTKRYRASALPEKEVLCQEIVDYVKLAFEDQIGRTTAQDWAKIVTDNVNAA